MLNNINLVCDPDMFEPGMFSIPELRWMLDQVGEPPIAAFFKATPIGVHRARVEPVLQRLFDAEELRRRQGVEWADGNGLDAIRDSINEFLAWHDRSEEIKRRTRGRISNASQWVWDATGRAFRFGVDSDNCEMIRTQILPDGSRKPFGVSLTGSANRAIRAEDLSDVAPWIQSPHAAVAKLDDKIVEFADKRVGYFRCSICEETQKFDPGSSQGRSSARARIARHLRTAKTEKNRHAILLSKWKR